MISFPNVVGLVVGVLFLGTILWLIHWLGNGAMPNLLSAERRLGPPRSNCILVPLTEEKTMRSKVERACQLASERGRLSLNWPARSVRRPS